MKTSLVISSCALAAGLSAADLPAVKDDGGARFAIVDTVAVPHPPRFGVNLEPPAMSHWNTEPFHNEWWGGPNPNPLEVRVKLVASGGAGDYIECKTEQEGGRKWTPGLGSWDTFRDGFFDGGDVWVWRYEGGQARYVRQAAIREFRASKAGPNRIRVDPGPEIRAGDEFVMRVVRRDIPKDGERTMQGNPAVFGRLSILDDRARKAFIDAGGSMDIPADAPPGGGGGSLRITVPAQAAPVSIGYWLMYTQRADAPRFTPGASYRLSFWAKQVGMDRPIEVKVGEMAKRELAIGPEWSEYTIPFMGAAPKETDPLLFTARGPGALYLDEIHIREIGNVPPDAIYPHVEDALRRYRPGMLRLWALQRNVGYGRSLDAGLGPVSAANQEFEQTRGGVTGAPVDLHQQLELCERIGAQPWIVVSTLFTPDEYRNLIEYLSGAPDTPYGGKRAGRGHPRPWSESFPRIGIELGNETWNRMFSGQGFNSRPKDYGQYAELVFRIMQAVPGFDRTRYTFILNGWTNGIDRKWGYSPLAIAECPSADVSGLAFYTGGWDAVGVIKAEDQRWGWFNILTFSYRMLRPRTEQFMAMIRDMAAERGRPIAAAVYEAGPGYTLPGPGKFNLDEQREGKSMAQAVNALDIFMLNCANGYADQAFFTFRNAHYWSSHNRTWGEHIAWKALALRNTLLAGDLITAKAMRLPTVDLPEAEAEIVSQSNSADRNVRKFPAMAGVPLIACHPFRDGKRYATMLYSRRLDAATPVTLDLPFEPKSDVHIHRLGDGDPSAHNIDQEVVTVREEIRHDAARSYTLTLPPSSVAVVVMEAP
jgi:hypothetical protein